MEGDNFLRRSTRFRDSIGTGPSNSWVMTLFGFVFIAVALSIAALALNASDRAATAIVPAPATVSPEGSASDRDFCLVKTFVTLDGVSATSFSMNGRFQDITTAQTGNITAAFQLRNAHLFVRVNTIVSGGDITVTGTAVDENSAAPVLKSEIINLQNFAPSPSTVYQTDSKWMDITSVILSNDITGINYDVGELQYWDYFNRAWMMRGYDMDCRSNNPTSDLGIRISNVRPLDGKLASVDVVELIGWDSTVSGGGFVDGVRTGADDRTYTSPVAFVPTNSRINLSQKDMRGFVTSDLLSFRGDLAGGLIIELVGVGPSVIPSGTFNNVEYCDFSMLIQCNGDA